MDYKNISNKYLLVDSDVLINYTKFQKLYQPFFTEVREANITLLVDALSKFEILRYATTPSERNEMEDFFGESLGFLSEMEMPQSDKEIYEKATKIANFYQKKIPSSKGISLTDCFLAARMWQFNENRNQLYLATENHKDFPQLLFERLGIETIDTRGNDNSSIHNIGIYEFRNSEITKIK